MKLPVGGPVFSRDLTSKTDKVKVKLRKYRQNMVVPTGFEPVPAKKSNGEKK
jgi:hypothetical protein